MEAKKQIAYLDFIKGFAAVSVVLLHALPKGREPIPITSII